MCVWEGVLKSFFHLYIQFWGICPTHHRLVWVRIVQVYFLESHFLPLIMSHLQNNRLIFIWVKRLLLKKTFASFSFLLERKICHSETRPCACCSKSFVCGFKFSLAAGFFFDWCNFWWILTIGWTFFPDLRNCDPTSRRSRTTATGSKSSLPRPSEIPPHFSFCQ